jgi:hypothetical protein
MPVSRSERETLALLLAVTPGSITDANVADARAGARPRGILRPAAGTILPAVAVRLAQLAVIAARSTMTTEQQTAAADRARAAAGR